MAENQELSPLEKLRVLLPHWLAHSKSHQEEFTKWADLAGKEGATEAAEAIGQALARLAEADSALNRALDVLGGPVNGPHHHHHH